MIFGGRLTSILVCQKCKHVSQTYEDFNDLSLSIKPEDYAKERKRDRLKNLAKRLAVFPSSSSSTLAVQEPPPRSSSAPPGTPREIPRTEWLHEPPIIDDPRHRSFDILPEPLTAAKDTVLPSTSSQESIDTPTEKHLEFGEMPKPDREKKSEDGWGRLGRRLSMGFKGKERKSRSRERRSSRDLTRTESSPTTIVETVPVEAPRPETPAIQVSSTPSPRLSTVSPAPSRPSSKTRIIDRGRSPKPPKPNRTETEYLRRILADVSLTSNSNPFARLNHAGADPQGMWFKMGQLPGIEDCLKMFTAVEILDGDNRVRCRRCWKIANGVYRPRVDHDDSDMEVPDVASPKDVVTDMSEVSLRIPTSLSTPELSDYSRSDASMSVVSLPTTIAESVPTSTAKHTSAPAPLDIKIPGVPGGMPIPLISTTAPPTPEDSPPPTARPNSLDSGSSDTHDHDIRHISLSAESLLSAPPGRHHAAAVEEDEESSSSEEEDTSDCSSKSPRPKKTPKPFILRPAYKRYLISTPPPVLVVHLKRFQQLSKTPMLSFSNGFKKLDDYVTFPEILDLTPFLAPRKEDFVKGKWHGGEEKCRYRLYAVVVHIGNMVGFDSLLTWCFVFSDCDFLLSSGDTTLRILRCRSRRTRSGSGRILAIRWLD